MRVLLCRLLLDPFFYKGVAMLFEIEKDKIVANDALENIVYIAGSARGGTTLLFRLLRLNKRIYGLPGMSHFYSNVWRNRLCMHNRLFSRMYEGLLPWFDVGKSTEHLSSKQGKSINRFISVALHNKDFKNLYKAYPLVSCLIEARNDNSVNSDSTCWLDKSNDWRGLNKIRKEFNNSKFIFIVRDPRSVVLSSAKRFSKKKNADNQRHNHQDIIRQAVSWRWMMDRFIAFHERNSDMSMIIRYEDLVHHSSDVLNNISNFLLGENITESDLNEMIGNVDGGASNSSDRYKGISESSIERWKKELTKKEINLIEYVAKNPMKHSLLKYQTTEYNQKNNSIFTIFTIFTIGVEFIIVTYLKIFTSKLLKVFGR